MRQTIHKLFWVWEFDKEEKWLNEMAARGFALVNKNWTRDSKNMSQKMGCGTTHADVLTGYDESSCKTSATLDSAPRNALEVLPTVRNS